MNITSYTDFLQAAHAQPEPQRLLFVFAEAELPDHPTQGQQERFQSGGGGALTPVMCVDKLPGELTDFASLADESRHTGQRWDIVFAASMSGKEGIAPSSNDAERPLKMMIDSIHRGAIEKFLAFDRSGDAVQFF